VLRAALADVGIEPHPAAPLDRALEREAAREVVAQVGGEEPVPRLARANRAQLAEVVDPDGAQVAGQRGVDVARGLECVVVGHGGMIAEVTVEALDILYVPSRDVATDLAYYRDVLGGRVVWAIERFGTRVAEVALAGSGPRLVLAEHLAAGEPVFMHRVDDLDAALAAIDVVPEEQAEFPLGPLAVIRTPGGQRIGLYEATRPAMLDSFAGRMDFS
jgi:predicted enzyme related to lactoylglutathione lyase